MSNVFSYQDQNAGLNAIGYKDENEEDIKQFNTATLDKYNQIIDEQKNFCFNFLSDDEAKEIQNKGKMDFLETASKHKLDELSPYWGSTKSGLKSIGIYTKLEKMKKGEILSESEKLDVKNYLKGMAECELRGRTLGGHVAEGIYSTVPFLIEAGIGFATASEGVGLLSLGSTGSKFALRKGATGFAKKEIRQALEAEARKSLIDKSKKLAIDSTLGVAKFSATKTPTQWFKASGDFLLSDDLAVSERGQYVLNEAKSNPAKAIMLGLGDTMIENFSETSGVLFGAVGKTVMASGAGNAITRYINKNVLSKLPSGFVNGFKDIVHKTTNLPFTQALKKYGYHGIIEEMGEERIGDFLRVVCNLDGEKGYSFEQFARALFPSGEQLATEAILFGITGGAVAGSMHGLKKGVDYARYKNIAENIKKESLKEDGTYNLEKMKFLIKKGNPDISNNNLDKVISSVTKGIKHTENYSLDDFLIDAGLFKTPYKESITDARLRSILDKTGMEQSEIETVMNFASPEEKSTLLQIHDEADDNEVQYDSLKQDLLRLGRSEEQAEAEIQTLTKIDEVLLNKYNDNGEAKELIKNRNLKILGMQSEVQQQKDKEFVAENLSDKKIMQFSAKDLKTDAKTFQYKDNSDDEGVTERLKDVQKWDAVNAGNIIVFENKDGEKFIVDGHQRLGLAKNLGGDIKLNGFLFREKDGYTPSQVRMIAAQKNIAEGSGTPIDTAKIIKELGGVEFYPKSLPTRGTLYEYGIPLSRLGNEAFEKVVNGFITPAQGAIIGNIIRDNYLKQSLAIDIITRANIETLQQTAIMAREVLNTDTTNHEQTNLFGTLQIFESVAVEKVKIVDGTLKQLKKSKNLMAHLASNSRDIESAGNKLNKKNNEEIKKSSEIAITVIEKLSSMQGEISEIANKLAMRYKTGDITLNEAIIQFRDFCLQPDILNIVFGKEKTQQNEVYAQSANTAGAEANEIDDAKKEWEEKGTDSKYFKKWFGDSKVVDENNQPLVVYHGSAVKNIEIFSREGASENAFNGWARKGYYFSNDKNTAQSYKKAATKARGKNPSTGKIYEVYLKMEKPLVVDYEGENFNDNVRNIRDLLTEIYNPKEYDGIIIKNINDNYEQSKKRVGDTYIVFNSEQIKSVDNKGTFDGNNPNIYYQSAYHGTPHRFEEFSLEHIGNGEGAQAHGWGLYFTANRDVAERYREILNSHDLKYDEKSVGLKQQYNMKNIDKYGKKSWIEELNKQLADAQKELRLIEKAAAKNNGNKIIVDAINEQKKIIVDIEEDIEISEKIDAKKISKGQVFEVDVPDADVLLDEDKLLDEQSDYIKPIIEKIIQEEGLDEYLYEIEASGYNPTGRYFYKALAYENGEEEASKILNSYGIKGIAYYGKRDGRCYVIFDDKAIKVLETYYQEKNKQDKARIEFTPSETIITLMKGNDASSVVHELAHLYLHDLQELAKVNERAKKDLQEVYDIFKFNPSVNSSAEDIRDLHEKFARSFEAYLLNGEAPTQKMKTLFERFKEFLKEVYESLTDLNVEFSEEVKRGFDKLFTTDEEYENEVLPLYKENQDLAESINKADTVSERIKNKTNEVIEAWKSFYDTVIIPIDTRLYKISPELKKILRKYTYNLTMESKRDYDKIKPFLLKIQKLKKDRTTVEFNKTQFNAYNLLSFGLNNRDSYTVNKVVKLLGIQEEFQDVRNLLDDIHEQAEGAGIEIGYLESYFPRMVKTDKADSFIEMFEKMAREEEYNIKEQLLEFDEAEYSNVKRTLQENDPHGLWNNEDKAKFINTSLRGFGKNNILLSRIGQLKFERMIDKLTPEQQRFYEPIEKALSNYIIGARKNIEERKFFGAENKEVSKLRTSIKRKRETMREVKTRKPAQAKWKELNRLKYELAPIQIKLDSITGEYKNNLQKLKETKDEEQITKLNGYIANQKEAIEKLQEQAKRLEEQIKWTEEANNLKVKYTVLKRLQSDIDKLSEEITSILGDAEHIEDSIGRLVQDLAEKGIIHVKDERIVRDLLVKRFNTIRLEKVAITIRDASTIVTLNDITNAVTQISDLTFSAFKFGLLNTFQGMARLEGLKREDLGLENIAEEFRGASPLSSWLNKQLKIIGLDLIDGFAKNVEINASVIKARKLAKKNNKAFLEKLEFLFDDNAEKVKQDLIDGKITDEILFIAFNDLADIQPITTDQMTAGYQSGFKPLYVLKTYSIKALDIVRNDCFFKISQGTKEKNIKLISEGLNNLIKLQVFMWLFGVPQDLLKDLLANKEFNIPEAFIDNLLIFGIFNRFLINKVSENPANIYLENVKMPAIQALADLTTAIKQVSSGKKDIKDVYVWSRVPIVGKMYYNWLGGKKNKRIDLR